MTASLIHNAILKYTLICCWILTAIIGYHGFFKNHELLTIPLLNLELPWLLTLVTAVIMFTTAILAVFSPPATGTYLYVISLLSYLIICIGDIHRVTPYMIVFYGIFTCFTFLKNDRHIFYTALIFILSGVYLFSGLHKFNTGFIEDIAPLFYFNSLPVSYNPTIGYAMAACETLLGLLLLFKSTRKIAATLLITMHLIIIWKLSPLKYGWNYIVIPWNLIMMVSHLYILKQSSTSRFKIGSRSAVFIGLAICFWAVPAMSQFLPIPENVSQKLYSGKSIAGYISFFKKEEHFKDMDLNKDPETTLISLQQLSMEQRGIGFNPELKYYEAVYIRFCENYSSTNQLHFEMPHEIIKNLP
ncbi:MauE/DoxX family redox-associated membrane protein [Nonlabens sp.]|uniref:MauE/DoxX family redox-associated membrane protein n=1 Tax=Nonlabens sp. TaxID=1888209 RepID=UPI003F69DAEF